MSNNPRKFSEKIALHNQKQAEGTAEFEKVLQEVFGAIMNANTQSRPNVNQNVEVNQIQSDLENNKDKLHQMSQKQINIQSQVVSNPQFQNLNVQNNQIFNENNQNNLIINQQNNLLDPKNDINLKKTESCGKMINFKGVDLNTRQLGSQSFPYQKTQCKLNNSSNILNMTSNYIPLQTTRSQINLHNNINNHLEIKDRFITKNNHYNLHSNRISYSPYHLTPPNSDMNWRRTNSDSALHQSTAFIEQRSQNQIQNEQSLFDLQQSLQNQNIYDQHQKIVIQQQNANKVNEENHSNSIINNNSFKNNLQILKNINNLSTWDPGKQNSNVHQQIENQAQCKVKSEKNNTSCFVTNPVISINYSNPSQNTFTSLDNSSVNNQSVYTSSIMNNNQENILCNKIDKPINTDQVVIDNECTNYQFSSLQSQNNSLNHMSQSNNQSFNSNSNIYQNSILSTNNNGFNTINTSTNHGFLYANNNVSSVSLPDLTSFNCQDLPSIPLEQDDFINNSLNSNDNSNNSNQSALSNGSYQLTNESNKSNNYKDIKNEMNTFVSSSFTSSFNYTKNNGNIVQNHSNSNSPSHQNTIAYGSLPNHHQMSNSNNFNIDKSLDNLQKTSPQLISQLNNQQVSSAFKSSSIESKEDTTSLMDQLHNDEAMIDDFENDLIQQLNYDFTNNQEARNTKYMNNDVIYDKNMKISNSCQNVIPDCNKNFYSSFYQDSNQLMNHRNVSTPSENASTAPNSPASSINNLNSPVNSPQEVNNNCPTSNQINFICKNSLANMTINNDTTINEDFLELDNFGSEEYDLAKSNDSSYQYLPYKYVNENLNGFNGEIINNQNKDVTILNYNLLNSTPLPTITLTEHNPDISNSNEFSH